MLGFTGSRTAPLAQADVTGLTAALAAKAALASPALTGNPTAPTASATDNDTSIATTAFVATALAALVNSAPGALDTLVELATALGNDASFAATVTNALALKAPLASPTLTGTPAAPTAAPGTNTTQLSTTAFVAAAIAALGTAATKNTGTTGNVVPLLNQSMYGVNATAGTTAFRYDGVGGAKILVDFNGGATTYLDQDLLTIRTVAAATIMTADATGIDVTGLARCDSLRIDQAPVAATPTPTHTISINLNGTAYRIPCVV